jgi:hypothetical protein
VQHQHTNAGGGVELRIDEAPGLGGLPWFHSGLVGDVAREADSTPGKRQDRGEHEYGHRCRYNATLAKDHHHLHLS